MIPTRDEAIKILDEMVENANLKQHMYCVEACMKAYAKKFGEDENKWGITGLLHDSDWEKYPDIHPGEIVKKLREMGVDEDICRAIAGHGNNSETEPARFEERKELIDKALFACDELAGFIVACARVRPTKLEGLEAKSVKKKLKDKAFAANVSRDDITQGAEELGVDLSEHVAFCIEAIKGIESNLNI